MTFETINQRLEQPAEDDRVAATASVSWGAGRFAVEFERREQEELMQHGSPFGAASVARDRAARGTWGPVQDDVADLVVEPAGEEVELRRLAPIRHPSVPRPPQEATEQPARVRRRRRHAPASPPQPPAIPAHEIARMSPAARRLYGLPEQP